MIIAAILLGFMVAQGGVVWATAHLALRHRSRHWLAKCATMSASYVAWTIFTILGFTLLGGGGGLMEGFGLVLGLCFSAFIGSAIFTVIWIAAPFGRRASHV